MVKVGAVVKPFGNVVLNDNAPVAAAFPMLFKVTGILEVIPSVKVGIAPITVCTSGRAIAVIGVVGVIELLLLDNQHQI